MSFNATEDQMIRYCNLKYQWRCPACGYHYESTPGENEGADCPECSSQCVYVGETYDCPEEDEVLGWSEWDD
jgi:hypothetical protein